MAGDVLAACEIWLRGMFSTTAALLLAGGALTTWLVVSALLRAPTNRYLQAGIFLSVSSTWLAFYSAGRFECALFESRQKEAWDFDDDLRDSELIEVATVELYTDRASKIPIFRNSAPALERLEPAIHYRRDRLLGLRDWTIELASADPQTNCHGWIFAEGKGIIRSQDVSRILRENGYKKVKQPTPGDLVVYRSQLDDSIIHTGLVKVIADDGIILVESKWGLYGRFLHQPGHQTYSQTFDYMRSPRNGHMLSGTARLTSLTCKQLGKRG